MITRFTTYNAGKTPGNGHILYAGMESVLGQAPTFFAGDTRRARLFMTYQQEKTIAGSYTPAGLITLHIPAADLAEEPTATTSARRTLYSATAFTATTLGTLKSNPEGLFNLTDATPPFNHLLGTPATGNGKGTGNGTGTGTGAGAGTGKGTGTGTGAGAGTVSGTGAGSGSGVAASSASGRLAVTGLHTALPLAGLVVLLLGAAAYRRRT